MDMASLHWFRPAWLWALLLLPLLIWVAERRARAPDLWRGVVDAHLIRSLLATDAVPARQRGWWWWGAAYVLAVVAMAGPSWRQVAQPVWRQQSPLVVAMDLSSATLLRDLPPSRLARARGKLEALLRARQGGQVGLVAFAGDAFTVAPLTDDPANVAVFLDALAPDVMPEDGQRVDRAIQWSVRLVRQAGHARGDVLVMGDHATEADIAAAARAAEDGVTVSVLGVGTASGRTALDEGSLRRLAAAGGGRYQRIRLDDADLRGLGVLAAHGAATSTGAEGGARHWLDEGYWLLPVVLLLVLPAFRRGAATAMLVLVVGLPLGRAQAAEWWRREDQVQHAAMAAATRHYRQGDFEGAAKGFARLDHADAHYNRGNALAKAGHYREAIRAYDAALQRAPGMADAIANRRAVEAAMKRRSPPASKAAPSEDQQGRRDPGGGMGTGTPGEASASAASQAARAGASTPTGKGASQTRGATPPDAARQAKADTAQRAQMAQALRGAQGRREEAATGSEMAGENAQARERRIANEAWLRRVPDDPGGLLREKFRLEHQRRQAQGGRSP